MLRGGDTNEVVRTQGSFTGFTKNVTGVAFSIVPTSASAKYPICVYLNGTSVDPVVVTSGAWQGGEAFHSLKVDVSPGRGEAGQEWKVFYAPTEADFERARARVDARGNLFTRVAEPVLLWRQILAQVIADGTQYLPSLASDSTASIAAGDLVDVKPYRFVKVSAWTQNGIVSPGAQEIALTLEVTDDSAGAVFREIPAGTVNNLVAATPRYSYVVAGEVDAAEDDNQKQASTRFNYARARLNFANGPTEIDGDLVVELWGYP